MQNHTDHEDDDEKEKQKGNFKIQKKKKKTTTAPIPTLVALHNAGLFSVINSSTVHKKNTDSGKNALLEMLSSKIQIKNQNCWNTREVKFILSLHVKGYHRRYLLRTHVNMLLHILYVIFTFSHIYTHTPLLVFF